MGELWLGHAEDGDLEAAIKLPTAGGDRAQEILDRFEKEAEILAGLDHPGILRVLDAGTAEDGRLFLVMEYVEGCDLRRLLRAERLPAERAMDIFSKVCEAMKYAHSEGVVHRDLKPSNVIVDIKGAVKVADFGLAKHLGGISTDGRTSDGDGLGTPYYLAPESMRNASNTDERADVYSLGVLLYEMLTGNVPQGSFTPLSERSGFARSWDALVDKALSDDRESRMPSVAELHDRAMVLWEREQLRGVSRKRFRWLAVAVLVALAALGGALWSKKGGATTPTYPAPNTAALETPWTNSLGMEFIPLLGADLLMATTETRLQDFEVFHVFEEGEVPEWRLGSARAAKHPGMLVMSDRGWAADLKALPSSPGYLTTPEHPIIGVTSMDAWAFCVWLTMKERSEGRLEADQRYRLPSITEWRSGTQDEPELFVQGNFARQEVLEGPWPPLRPVSEGQDDYPGFLGMAGNVSEWVLPSRAIDDPEENEARFIGYSWADPEPTHLNKAIAGRNHRRGMRRSDIGVGLVLELSK